MKDRLRPSWQGLLDDLKARGVKVIGILLPRGSWTEGAPAEAFSDEMRRIYAQRQIPLLDYSRSVPDADYMDSVHYSFKGRRSPIDF